MVNKYSATLDNFTPAPVVLQKTSKVFRLHGSHVEYLAMTTVELREKINEIIGTKDKCDQIKNWTRKFDSHSFHDFLIKTYNLQVPANWVRFKKNVKDGYLCFFIYNYRESDLFSKNNAAHFQIRDIEKYLKLCFDKISSARELRKNSYRDQTHGIKDYIKKFKPSVWKRLISFTHYELYELYRALPVLSSARMAAQFSKTPWETEVIINQILEKTDDFEVALFIIQGLNYIFSNLTFNENADSEPWFSLVDFIGFIVRNYEYLNDRDDLSDVKDHFFLYQQYREKYYNHSNNSVKIETFLSAKWNCKRFLEEHSRLTAHVSKLKFQEEVKSQIWRKKTFYNLYRFPELKCFTVKIDQTILRVEFLNKTKALFNEGEEMKHCIYSSFLKQIEKGHYIAFKVRDPNNPKNNCTAGFRVNVKGNEINYNQIISNPHDEIISNPHDEKNLLKVDQIKGLENHVDFTFNTNMLNAAIIAKMESIGFDDYLEEKSIRPLEHLSFIERRRAFQREHQIPCPPLYNGVIGDRIRQQDRAITDEGFFNVWESATICSDLTKNWSLSLKPNVFTQPRTVKQIMPHNRYFNSSRGTFKIISAMHESVRKTILNSYDIETIIRQRGKPTELNYEDFATF